jgi:hypothetical protein
VPGDEAGLLEVVQDEVHRPLGDADVLGDLAHEHVPTPVDAEQHVGVVRQERPPGRRAVAPSTHPRTSPTLADGTPGYRGDRSSPRARRAGKAEAIYSEDEFWFSGHPFSEASEEGTVAGERYRGTGHAPRTGEATVMSQDTLRALQEELLAQSFLFDRPQDYRAGVEDALRLFLRHAGATERREPPLAGSAV